MDKIDYKKVMTLAHLYDFLEDQIFHGFWQLEHINKKAFDLCKKINMQDILNLINELKKELPIFVVAHLEKSRELRYLCCDCFHDAQIINIQIHKNIFNIDLDMNGSYCGFKYKNDIVKIKIETNDILNDADFYQILNFKSNPLIWINSEIKFKDCQVNFDIELSNFDANKEKIVNHIFTFELKNITFYN